MKDRSIYYALRKNTKCETKPVLAAASINSKSQVTRMKLKAMEEYVHKTTNVRGKGISPSNRQRHDQLKVKYRKLMKNDIEHLLSKNEKHVNKIGNDI